MSSPSPGPGPGGAKTAQVLMRKGKRGAGAYIHADCASGSPQHLAGLLDVLLHPNKAIDEWETIDWCRWLIAGGRTPDEFSAIVRSYDNHAKCGLVWIPHVVAYRCRTCGISPCMSICRECFRRGDHSTHDFNMFLSQAGGACDCGDTSVMKEDGFCSSHGINNCANKSPAPADLMCVAEATMPRVILRLLQHFRENRWGAESNSDTYRKAVQECEGYVAMLMEFNNMGELMRKAMTKALINPQMYRNMVEPPFPQTEYGMYLAKSMIMYEAALDSFPAPEPPPEYKHLPALSKRMQHTTLLEEFIFWTFKYEFPQNIVCFLLNMLPDQDYKEHLTRTFVMHYARIPLVLELSADPDMLSNRVVHMSVQLFSNEALALRCQHHLSLLHVMVVSLQLMMSKILLKSTLHDEVNNKHMVIDCARRVMKEHCYWPLVSDFNNVLSHKSVALVFLQDDTLIDMWFQFLSMLQGMNVNERELGSHVEYEPSSYYAAFSCELEASAYPMWSIISHLTGAEHTPLARKMVACCLRYLKQWLKDINFSTPYIPRCEIMRASFHFPLHRYLAALVCQAVRHMGCSYSELLPDTDTLFLLMMHPLRVQSLFYEILSSIWVRNGLQIKGQAMTYIQANFCNSMVDMDIYFLQVCAAHLPTHQFIDICIKTFGVSEWLGLGTLSSAREQEQDAMVEGLLTLLATLVSSRTNLSHTELTQSRLEVSTLLATSDKTHSQLLELMPERSGNAHTRNFETVLKELSYYRAPPKGSETLEQGQFAPKAIVWDKHYDPLHVLQRAVHRRDFQNSMDRFTQYVKSRGGASAKLGSLWPPLRRASNAAPAPGQCDPRRLAACGRVHAMCMSVLHRAVHRKRPPQEHVLALAVYLLETAVDLESEKIEPSTICQYKWDSGSAGNSSPKPLLDAFPSDSVTQNACATLGAVCPPPPVQIQPRQTTQHAHNYPAAYDSDSDTEWDPLDVVENPPMLALQEPTESVVQGQSVGQGQGEGQAPPTSQLLVHHDYVMREEEEEEPYQLALPAPQPDITIQDMSVALPANMTMVPTSLQVSEMYVGEEEGDSISMELEEEEDSEEVMGGEVALTTPHQPSINTNHHNHRRTNKHTIAPSSESNYIMVNESLVSLLLKLHSQLSGTLDSFSLDDEVGSQDKDKEKEGQEEGQEKEKEERERQEPMEQGHDVDPGAEEHGESRIGDGPYFIGQLLRKMCALDPGCTKSVEEVRGKLWPRQRERQAEQRAREQREREERTRRARERQRTLMQDFMSKQKEFMRRAMEEGGEGGQWLCEEEEPCMLEKDYDCIICNTRSHSTTQNPIGLVVLLQSSSVVGHRRLDRERANLPLSDADRNRQKPARDLTLAAHHFSRQHDMDQHFDSWLVSVNIGWEGGVHVQTCGHHVHLTCLQAYLRSLVNPQRPHNLHTDRGEFLCPVCRQLANSVLPLSPGLGGVGAPPRCMSPPQETLLSDISAFLEDHQRSLSTHSNLSEAMGKAMEDMTNCAALRFKQRAAPGPQALFLFVASVARTNLEAELVQRGGSLACPPPRYKPRPDCIVPLLDVLGVHARMLCQWPAHRWWQELTQGVSGDLSVIKEDLQDGQEEEGATGGDQQLVAGSISADDSSNKALPLLLKDPLALLIHLLLLAPLHLELPYLTCMFRALYNLSWVQCVIQALLSMSPSQLEVPLPSLPSHLLNLLQATQLFHQEDQPQPSTSTSVLSTSHWSDIDKQIQQQMLPYLRVCALLRYHLSGQELPHIPQPQYEFHYLFKFLEFTPQDTSMESIDTSSGLKWFSGSSGGVVTSWVNQLLSSSSRCPLLTRRLLLPQHHHWEQPALLRLPREYDRLFTYYHERICSGCGAVPKEVSVCLVCGAVVCLKQSCCRQQDVCEAVQHSMDCGGGTGVFLVVTSTYIIIIRGRRACLWGSLYLDDYDEEDRDLKRGKPLYLSEDRFELLEQQWLAHRFDHTKRTWVWHRDSL